MVVRGGSRRRGRRKFKCRMRNLASAFSVPHSPHSFAPPGRIKALCPLSTGSAALHPWLQPSTPIGVAAARRGWEWLRQVVHLPYSGLLEAEHLSGRVDYYVITRGEVALQDAPGQGVFDFLLDEAF